MLRREFVRHSLQTAAVALLPPMLHSQALPGNSAEASLSGVQVGDPIPVPDSHGDTWTPALGADGNLYSPSNDTHGFHHAPGANVAFSRISGPDPLHLTGVTVNPMQDYGGLSKKGPDGCTWKSSGCTFLEGNLYLVVARHHYGENSGDPYRRQTAQNASIIRSSDYGLTWTRPEDKNYSHPMFPGSHFATPYFIHFGAPVPAFDDHIYALSNNGFWDCGDFMVLGRVKRSQLHRLHARDWEFFTGGDGMSGHAWSHDASAATPVLSSERRLGMTGAVYLPAQRCFFMIGWYYPAGGGKMPGAKTHTVWTFYRAPQPWGPWTAIGEYDSSPSGYYSPQVCPSFQTPDRIYAFAAGNWDSPPDYRLTVFPLDLTS